jgi:SAM-dependent methyltransferase
LNVAWLRDRARGGVRMLTRGDGPRPTVAGVRGQIEGELVNALIEKRVDQQPALRPVYESMSDEVARMHYGHEDVLEQEHLRKVTRFFHAWKAETIRTRAGDKLATAKIVDVGDSDGLLLKELGKTGTGFNLSEPVIENIRSNGIEAVIGDGHELPFTDGEYDFVFCFQTLEHAENPHQLLSELARVCAKDGRVFLSIPWVPETIIHARIPHVPRGEEHIFEFSRPDFAALLSHTPLQIVWTDDCDILGDPSSVAERALVASTRRNHLVAGTFRKFQFYELAHR